MKTNINLGGLKMARLLATLLILLDLAASTALAQLPSPWVDQDIGGVGAAGSVGCSAGTFTVKGSGVDIDVNTDEFHYVYQPLSGDGQIVARVTTVQNTNFWAKAGVMIRETLSPSSPNAFMLLTPGSATMFQRRTTAGGGTFHTSGGSATAPYWVKVARSGDNFSGYTSGDGVNWVLIGTSTLSMSSSAYAGLAITSHDDSALNTSVFDNVSVTGGAALPPPAPSSALSSLTISPTSVTGSSSAQATVSLTTAAPSGGAVVTLSSSNLSVATVPASVTVAGSASSASFSVTTKSVSASTSVTISGSYSGMTKAGALTVSPVSPTLSSLTLNPTSVTGGGSALATVTLTAAAPAGDAVVTLSSSNLSVATVPASVTVAGGTSNVSFSVATKSVSASTSVTISGSYNGTTRNAMLPVSPAPAATTMPNPWAHNDIGGVLVTGSASYSAGTFAIKGAGTDIDATADQFHYVYQPLNGDGQILARIASIQNTSSWAKAGVMIRQLLTSNSANVSMLLTPGNGLMFQRRTTAGGSTLHTSGGGAAAPYWVKLARSGSSFNCYKSADGINWVLVGTAALSMTSNVYVGLALTSHNDSVLNTSLFDNVSVTSGTNPPPPPPSSTLSSLTLNPTSVIGGNSAQGTIALTSAAPAVGAMVTLSSNNSSVATVPASFTVPAGVTSADFTVTTKSVSASTSVTFSASYGGVTRTAVLTVSPTPPPPPPPTTGRQFYVAPNGTSSGDGSIARPWDLATALSHPAAVKPGDTIWLRGGTYRGTFNTYLTGSPSAPIIVRQYPGELAALDASGASAQTLIVYGADTWYWGFEVTNSDPNYRNQTSGFVSGLRGGGIDVQAGARTKFINLIVHDGQGGYGFWSPAVDAEIYGNIIYNVGVEGPDRGHGHSIYVQNQTGTKHIVDNILFNGFSFGIHAYTSGNYLDNLHIEGNATFNHGILSQTSGLKANILIGGGDVADDPILISNYAYSAPSGGGRAADLSYGAGCNSPTIKDNYFVSGTALNMQCANVPPMTGNTFYGAIYGFSSSQHPNNAYYTSRPAGTKVFVRPNKYEPGRAHIIVYNWDRKDTVDVDVSAILPIGAQYEVRNAQDYFNAPVLVGTYNGTPLLLPMTGLGVAKPAGWAAPAPTGPDFNVFVLIKR